MVSALITPTIKKCSIIYCYICIPVPWNTCVKSYLKKSTIFYQINMSEISQKRSYNIVNIHAQQIT